MRTHLVQVLQQLRAERWRNRALAASLLLAMALPVGFYCTQEGRMGTGRFTGLSLEGDRGRTGEHPGSLPASRAVTPFPAVSCGPKPPSPGRVAHLAAGTVARQELNAGVVHHYDVRLSPGQSLQIVADQGEVDLVLCLYGPEGRLYLGLDSPNGTDEPEELLWLAEEKGTYRLLIRAYEDIAKPRYYGLTTRISPASRYDQERFAALLAGARAEEMALGPDPSLWPRARDEYLSALASWKKFGDRGRQGDLEKRMGCLYERRLKDLGNAAISYGRAREHFARLGMKRREGLVLASLARVSKGLGWIEEALGHQQRALSLFEELGDRYEQAVALNEIGCLYGLLAEPHRALDSYSRSLERWRQAGDREQMAATLHNRGLLYSSLGSYQAALDDLSEAADTARRSGGAQLAATLTALGTVHTLAGQPAKGLPFLEEALTLRIRTGELRGQGVSQSAIGVALQRLGRPAAALDRHRRAQRIFDSFDDLGDKATALHNVGVAMKQAGRPLAAARALASAVERGRQVEDEKVVEASLFALAQIRSEQGDKLGALSLVENALQSIETFRPRSPSQGLRAAFFATKQDYYDFTVDLLMDLQRQHPGKGYEVAALDVSERSRARSLLDLLQERGIESRHEGPAALIAAKRRLAATIRAKDRFVVRRRDEGLPTEGIERELRNDLREYDRFADEIRRRSPSYQRLAQARPLTAEEIQKRVLDPGTILLYYKFGRQSCYLWVVTPDSIVSFVLPAREEIEKFATRLHDLLSGAHRMTRAQTELTLRKLSDFLLGPAWDLLGDKRLLILGEGALQSIPFAALPVPEEHAGGPPVPLVVDHEIVTAPSASALAMLQDHRARFRLPLERVAVLADPVFSTEDLRTVARRPPGPPAGLPIGSRIARGEPSYPRLRHSSLEARAISSWVKRGNLFTATGFSASRETVLNGGLRGYQIVHFATHGEIDSRNPELSRLVLSLVDEDGRPQEGFLYAYEIFGLDIPAELVVLSACRSGLGQEIRGEGLVGLPQAFLYAGAARVVASLWNVGDRETALLFQSFYRHLLLGGKTPSAALRAAQIERWKKQPGSYHWAAFVLHDR
jgi:CHAT domain-containing protein